MPYSLRSTPNFWEAFYWCKSLEQGTKDWRRAQNGAWNRPLGSLLLLLVKLVLWASNGKKGLIVEYLGFWMPRELCTKVSHVQMVRAFDYQTQWSSLWLNSVFGVWFMSNGLWLFTIQRLQTKILGIQVILDFGCLVFQCSLQSNHLKARQVWYSMFQTCLVLGWSGFQM